MPLFLNLLKPKKGEISYKGIQLIGILASKSAYFRDTIIKEGGISDLVQICSQN